MSEPNFNNSQREHLTVPLEAPPAYEPKPEDETDVEQNATQDNHSNITKKLISRRFFVSFALVVLSLWFTMLVLDAAGVRRSGVIYSDRYSEEHRFRPAASPIITEVLADGRTRIRGAERPEPT